MRTRLLLLIFLTPTFFSLRGLAAPTTEPAQAPSDDAILVPRAGTQFGVLPILNYSTSRGVTTGVLSQIFDYGNQSVLPFEGLWTLQFAYATQAETSALVDYERTHVSSLDLRVHTTLYISHNTSQRYYGTGDSTLVDPVLEAQGYYFYTQNRGVLATSARKEVAPQIDVLTELEGDYDRTVANQEASQFYKDFGAPPDPETFRLKASAGAVLDRRDSEFIPTRGWYAADVAALSEGWWRDDADMRWYWPWISSGWLGAAFQLRYSYTSDNAPIYEKARLGGLGTLRGLRLNRYLTDHTASARSEIRSTWFHTKIFGLPARGGLGLFAEAGKAGDDFQRLLNNRVIPSWGISALGGYFTEDFVGHADVAFSPEGMQTYVALGYSF